MIIGIILAIGAVIMLIMLILNHTDKSEILGEEINGLAFQISGKLHILSSNAIPLKNEVTTYFRLFEKGIRILQGTTSIEIPWGAIYDINTANYNQVVSKDKSVIGRAAVGGLLFGDVGAIIGGMSGMGQTQSHIGGDLFVISFEYSEFGKTSLGIRCETGVAPFVKKYTELREEYDNNQPKVEEDKIYDLGYYNCTQVIQEEQEEVICALRYNATKELWYIGIDGRNALFTAILNREQKETFTDLLKKAKEWNSKALEAKMEAKKNVGMVECVLSLNYDNKTLYVNNAKMDIDYSCWFDLCVDDDMDNYYHVSLATDNVNVTDENVQIPFSMVFLKMDAIMKIVETISDANTKAKVEELINKKEVIDSILN